MPLGGGDCSFVCVESLDQLRFRKSNVLRITATRGTGSRCCYFANWSRRSLCLAPSSEASHGGGESVGPVLSDRTRNIPLDAAGPKPANFTLEFAPDVLFAVFAFVLQWPAGATWCSALATVALPAFAKPAQ